MVLALTAGFFSSTFAEDDVTVEGVKTKRMEMKSKVQQLKESTKEAVSENREEIKENISNYREENKKGRAELFAGVDKETRTQIKILIEETKAQIESLKAELAGSDDKEGILKQVEAVYNDHIADVKTLLADYPEALEAIQDRTEVFEANKTLREENKKTREAYRWARNKMVQSYKANFVKKIGNKLDAISDDRLEKLLDRIDTMESQFEENTEISDERRDTVISQLIALKELIQEHLEDTELDIDSLLSE